MTVTVTLTDRIVNFADWIATGRMWQAFLKERENKNGLTGSFDELMTIEKLGTRCEAAGKLYLNPIHWNAYAEKITHLPDLGSFIDVKGRSKHWHEMVVQRDDEDDFAFLLIRGHNHPVYEIVGWAWGHEAKRTEFWKDPAGGRAAYFVPPARLRPPETLREIVHPNKQAAE